MRARAAAAVAVLVAVALAGVAPRARATTLAEVEEPVAVVAIGEAAGSFVQLADKPDDFCAPGTRCPTEGSVCCKGGKFCCRYGCDHSDESKLACRGNPEQMEKRVIDMAKAVDKAARKQKRRVDDEEVRALRTAGDAKARLDQCRVELDHVKDDAKAAKKAASRAVRRVKNKCAAKVRRAMSKCSAAARTGPGAAAAAAGASAASRGRGAKRGKDGKRAAGKRVRKRGGKKGKKGRRLSVSRLKSYSPDKLVRIVSAMYRQRQSMRRRLRKAGVVRRFASCKEIKRRNPKARSGRYTLRLRRGHLVTVHCDMVTDGGGWTALLNPASFPTATFPGLLFEPTTVSGTETCGGSDFVRKMNGWNAIYHYKCGNVVTRSHYRWANVLGATDVLLRATLQGETERHMSINGRYVGFTGLHTPKAGAPSAGSCAFYTGAGEWTTETGINRCASTPVPQAVKPLVLRSWLAPSQQLNMKLQSGRAALPTPQYGTGWNIATLMVR